MQKSNTNVIWIFGDQHRGQSLGFRGDPNLSTPNLDRLAVRGKSFDEAVVNCPLCSPARGSLLTSYYPHRAVKTHGDALDPKIPTVAHAFKNHDYHTAWFGKWHVDGMVHFPGKRACDHIVPRERRGGFDTWLAYEANSDAYDTRLHGHDDDREVAQYSLPGFSSNVLTDQFIQHLEKRAASPDASGLPQPFFAALSVQPPHNPYSTPEQWMAGKSAGRITFRPNVPDVKWVRERAARDLSGYCAAIENLDWNVGRIVDALERLGLYSNTRLPFLFRPRRHARLPWPFSQNQSLRGIDPHPHDRFRRRPDRSPKTFRQYFGQHRGHRPDLSRPFAVFPCPKICKGGISPGIPARKNPIRLLFNWWNRPGTATALTGLGEES